MLHSFAITPDVFESSVLKDHGPEAVIVLELLRGLGDNGLVANLQSGQWLRQVVECQQPGKSSPDLWDKIHTLLNYLHTHNRIIRHPNGTERSETDDFRWLHWALERHCCEPSGRFDGIFSTVDYLELSEIQDDVFVPLNNALNATCWTRRRRSTRFEKTGANLKKHLAPLIRYARKLTLIDPYMTCHEERFFNTVQHGAELLGLHYGRAKVGRIDIHAGDPSSNRESEYCESHGDRLKAWGRALTPVAKHFHQEFRVYLWKNKPGGKRFHDRYLISDQMGIAACGGLDFVDDVGRANWSSWTWIESQEIDEICNKEFNKKKSPYQFLGKIEVLP